MELRLASILLANRSNYVTNQLLRLLPIQEPPGTTPVAMRPQTDDFLSPSTPALFDSTARHSGLILLLGAGGKIQLHFGMMVRRTFAWLGHRKPTVTIARSRTPHGRKDSSQRGAKMLVCDLEKSAESATLPDALIVISFAGVISDAAVSLDFPQRLIIGTSRRATARFQRCSIFISSSGCIYRFLQPSRAIASAGVVA